MVAKASPAEVKDPSKYEKLEKVSTDFNHGNVNEKFHTMDTQMQAIDTKCTKEQKQEAKELEEVY